MTNRSPFPLPGTTGHSSDGFARKPTAPLSCPKILVVAVALALGACTTISPFNQKAYEQATSLKVDTLAMMDKGNEPYALHESDIRALQINLDKAYEYCKGLPKNDEATSEWNILRSKEGNSFGGFLRLWAKKNVLQPAEIADKKDQISKEFDQLIGLEGGKRKIGTTSP